MASSLSSINLIRTKTSSSPQLDAIEASIRRSGYIGLIGFLCISFLIGVVYVFFYMQKTNLEAIRKGLMRQVIAQAQKQAMYLSIKDRVHVVEKTISNQKPWAQLLDQITATVPPPVLTGITIDDQSKITITIKTDSLDTLLGIVNGLIVQVQEKHILNPQLLSFQIGKTDIQATISFYGVF